MPTYHKALQPVVIDHNWLRFLMIRFACQIVAIPISFALYQTWGSKRSPHAVVPILMRAMAADPKEAAERWPEVVRHWRLAFFIPVVTPSYIYHWGRPRPRIWCNRNSMWWPGTNPIPPTIVQLDKGRYDHDRKCCPPSVRLLATWPGNGSQITLFVLSCTRYRQKADNRPCCLEELYADGMPFENIWNHHLTRSEWNRIMWQAPSRPLRPRGMANN